MSLNLALVISGDASGAREAAQETTAAVRETGRTATETSSAISAANDQSIASAQRVIQALNGQDAAQRKLQQSIQSMVVRAAPTDGAEVRRRAQDIEVYGRQLDGLRAKFNPVYAAIQQYKTAQAEIRQAHRLGAISSGEMASAMERERQATLASISAIKQRQQAGARPLGGGPSGGRSSFNTSNLAAQGFDIAATSAFMPFYTVALQQGPQVAQVFNDIRASGQAIGPAVASAFMQIINPVSLLTIGVIGLTAASVQWLTSSETGAKSVDDAMQAHIQTLDEIDKAYGRVRRSSDAYGRQSVASAEAAERRSRRELQALLEEEKKKIVGDTMFSGFTLFDLFSEGSTAPVDPRFAAFAEPLMTLRKEIAAGGGDLEAFQKRVKDIAQVGSGPFRGFVDDAARLLGMKPEGLDEAADVLIGMTDAAARAQAQLRTTWGMLMTEDRRGEGQADARRYVAQRSIELARSNQQFAAEQQMAAARTNAERLAAVEAQVRSRVVEDGDKGGGLQARVDRALEAERNRQAIAARNATEQRAQALTRSVEQQRLEADMIGVTTGEAARLRFEFERMQELREEARRTGSIVDPAEEAAIKAAAAAMKTYADETARKKLLDDAMFERAQLGRTATEKEIASRLRGTGLDANSPEASYLRQNQALERQVKLWEDIRDVGRNAIDSITDVRSFEDLQAWFEGFASDITKQLLQLTVANPLKNALYGDQNPTLDSIGGLGGFVGTLLGRTANPASGQSVGAMNVNAGTVMINGAPVGGVGALAGSPGSSGMPEMAGGWGKNVSRMFAPANGNGAAGGDIAAYIRQAAQARGIDPETALRVARSEGGLRDPFRQGEAMLSYGREESYGPFQLHMRQGGVGTRALKAGIDPRTNWQGGVDYALDEAATKGWGQWFGAAKVGVGKWDGLNGAKAIGVSEQLNASLERTIPSLDKLTLKSADAGDGLGNLFGGLVGGKGQMPMAGAFPPAPGRLPLASMGSGGMSGLLSMFGGAPLPEMAGGFGVGGGGGIFGSLFKMLLGFLPGFAEGTPFAPGGLARINERGGEIVDLPTGARVYPRDLSRQMAANAGRGGVSVSSVTHIHNNAPVRVRQEESQDENGNRRMDIYVDEQVARTVSKSGSQTGQAMAATFGTRRSVKVR